MQDPVGWYLQPPPASSPGGRGRRVAAALLSAILPGAGKAYCGRGADGLQSLLIVGTAALLAYRGFERDGRRSLEGWGGAGVGGLFYAGGIVGAAVSWAGHSPASANELKRRLGLTAVLPKQRWPQGELW
jgi:hypothetical protein